MAKFLAGDWSTSRRLKMKQLSDYQSLTLKQLSVCILHQCNYFYIIFIGFEKAFQHVQTIRYFACEPYKKAIQISSVLSFVNFNFVSVSFLNKGWLSNANRISFIQTLKSIWLENSPYSIKLLMFLKYLFFISFISHVCRGVN